MATRKAKVEGTPKKEKKFKYNCTKGYPTKTPLEDGYKVVVWNATKAYNLLWRKTVWRWIIWPPLTLVFGTSSPTPARGYALGQCTSPRQ